MKNSLQHEVLEVDPRTHMDFSKIVKDSEEDMTDFDDLPPLEEAEP